MARIVDEHGRRLPDDGRGIFLSVPNQGRFRVLSGRTTAKKPKPPQKPRPGRSLAGAGVDVAALIEALDALLQAFGEAALPGDTGPENIVERLQAIAARAGKNPWAASRRLSRSVARRVLARRKPQATRCDVGRMMAGVKALGGRPEAIAPATLAIMVQASAKLRG